jgi:pimeloyl-ACP methyl ester carboxylesterase
LSDWREVPIFVPFDGEHMAAVVTTPADDPSRALVLLLTGWGATRSHRGRIWTQVARSLAERGIASARFDYPGIGDSTGTAQPTLDAPPVAEALAVIEAAREVTGDLDVGLAGNCVGAQTAFSVAARVPECKTVVGIILRKPGDLVVNGHRGDRSRKAVHGAIKTRPRLTRLAKSLFSPIKHRPSRFMPDVESVLRTRSCLLLFLGEEKPATVLARSVNGVSPDTGTDRSEVRHVRTPPIIGFKIPLELQPDLIDTVVEWLDARLPGGERRPVEPAASTG